MEAKPERCDQQDDLEESKKIGVLIYVFPIFASLGFSEFFFILNLFF